MSTLSPNTPLSIYNSTHIDEWLSFVAEDDDDDDDDQLFILWKQGFAETVGK